MTKLILARHGESEANVLRVFSNQPGKHRLTALGRGQAEALAESLSLLKPRTVTCSPLLRAIQTAQIVGSRVGMEPIVNTDLIEYDVGRFEGRDDDQSWKEFFGLSELWSAGEALKVGISGGESPVDMGTRLNRVLRSAVSMPGTHIAVTHGGLLRCGLPMVLPYLERGYFADKWLEPAAFAVLGFDGSSWKLEAWNVRSLEGIELEPNL